jgi:alkaline phosphatase
MKRTFSLNIAVAVLLAAGLLLLGQVAPVAAKGKISLYEGAPAKYVFLFIGDGMGFPQKTAAEQFQGKALRMDQFLAQGVTTTYAADRFITGSAASATALAAGQKTNIGVVGMTPDLKPVKSVAHLAKEQGKKVGIVSSVSIDHATPAAFYAHVPKRSMYHEIDHALAESGFDFFGGGGLKDPDGKRVLKKNPDAKTLGNAIEKAKENGYKIVTDKESFMALKPEDGKVLAWNAWLQDSGAMPYAIDMTEKDITLPEFTAKAIEMLDNEKGFFLMVEAGKIDWACHANDGTSAVINTLAFDDAIGKAMQFAEKHPEETLIVVTGDHECGGLTIGFAGTKYEMNFDVLGAQKVSYVKFDQEIFKNSGGDFEALKLIVTENFGLKFEGDPKEDILVLEPFQIEQIKTAFQRAKGGDNEKSENEETYLLYGEYNPLSVTLTHILNQKAGLGWTSYKHTGVPVGTMAMGVGAEVFDGYYDNIDVALKIFSIMGIESKVHAADDSGETTEKLAAN